MRLLLLSLNVKYTKTFTKQISIVFVNTPKQAYVLTIKALFLQKKIKFRPDLNKKLELDLADLNQNLRVWYRGVAWGVALPQLHRLKT